MAWRPVLLAVTAVLVVTAGCTTLSGQSAEPTAVTPAPVPEQTPGENGRSLVPGLATERVVDAEALAAAHAGQVRNRSYTLSMDWAAAGQERESLLRVENERRYRYRSETATGGYGDRSFVDGGTRFSRHERPLGVEYVTGEAVPARERVSGLTRRLVRNFLGVGNSTVTVREGETGRYYLVRTTHPEPPSLDDVHDFRARARVDPTGLVRSMDLAFRNPRQNTTVRYSFEYTALDETAVDRPTWVKQVWPNATGGDRQRLSDSG
ncbi:hypothetical protein ACFQL1_04550 [Halomicroarcula sp. GCM10025709]|uniref:hypothetical protein n=1 Tax=Haloarcula TaxID=2237 RepID=UPI0024C2ACA2|nr:hypothetical protein [Halomicroarcula sp. YJ-61-S]